MNTDTTAAAFKPNRSAAPASLSKRMLLGHSGIGLLVGALMYLICISGSIAVFYPELERWEQPQIPEFQQMAPQAIQQGFSQHLAGLARDDYPKKMFITLPTAELPRAHISVNGSEYWLDSGGHRLDDVTDGWTAMLTALHINLLLPKNLGIVIVSLLGVMLVGLTLSGVLAHKRIFKDAFTLRVNAELPKQVDIHNRLSVWGLPFHLMIGLTGAFFGLVGPFILVAVSLFYEGDQNALIKDVYGHDPVINQASQPFYVDRAFDNLATIAPEAQPLYAVVQQPGGSGQYIEIGALLPQRLIYSEIYRFNSDGSYIDHQQMGDGPLGRQLAYSIYRIHFGHFGGYGTKLMYLLLGLALTVISVTGINIWLQKRNRQDGLDRIWAATVWGAPLALCASAIAATFALPVTLSFLASYAVAFVVAGCARAAAPNRVNQRFKAATALALAITAVVHQWHYRDDTISAAAINIDLLLLGVSGCWGLWLWHCHRQHRSPQGELAN
ncbi:PepSY-associated TM helix domain-containing protein [uncultured Ferrimonas sp.]|uniref:PepSY-associated TM helix domain-containing protein n=1 Tax=uncultured Ferrimonas sp. TaxID=432640 RepID=UPI0026287E0B|nr:PepSY-associated TM helix domain-containing protein [uncultured Ferrimonas sp.]